MLVAGLDRPSPARTRPGGVPVHRGPVLAEARIRPHKVRGWLNRAYDPAFSARAGAVCRLYLHPEPGTA
jgi:hypothetical protein